MSYTSKSRTDRQGTVHVELDITVHVDVAKAGPNPHEKAKKRNKWYEKEQRRRLRSQRRQYAIAKMAPRPEPVATQVLVNGELRKLPRFGTHQQRLYVLDRDGYRCRYCGDPLTMDSANLDHVKPHKHGGQTDVSNLVASCQDCNKAKGNQHWQPSANIQPRKG